MIHNIKINTKNFRERKLNPFVFSKWSTNRPGVATMIWGFFANISAWEIISIPPTITAHFTPIVTPLIKENNN